MNALVNGSFNVDMLGAGRRALAPKFYYEQTPITTAGDDEIRVEPRLCIAFSILGESTVTRRLATEQDKKDYAAVWQAFAEGREAPLEGTPIEQLPGITERVAALAAIHGIRTVEQMATDKAMMMLGMEGREWNARAKAWLEQKAGAAALDQAAAVAAMQAQIEKMTKAMAAMQMQLEVKDAALTAMKQATGQPAGPQVTKVDRSDEDFALAMTSDPMSDGDGLADDLGIA